MTQNEHVYEICCRPEVDDDFIPSRNVKTIEGYIVVSFEVASSSSCQDFSQRLFCDCEVGNGGVNVTCSRPEVAADYVITSEDADFPGIYLYKFMRENRNQPLM